MSKFTGILVYVAGPYRSNEIWKLYENIENARKAAIEIVKMGAYPIVPHKCTDFMEGLNTSEFFIEGTREAMRRCDVLYIIPGYESSEGTLGEIAEGENLRKPIFYSLQDLQAWLQRTS